MSAQSTIPQPQPGRDAAYPFAANFPFVAHAVLAFAGLAWLNHLIDSLAPKAVQQIGTSYLIQYYHVPAAISMYLFFLLCAVSSVVVLVHRSPAWDRRAHAFGQTALLLNGIVLGTGMVWGKTAWGVWWDWADPRLLTSGVAFLMYLGYVMLQDALRDDPRRARFAAIYGIVALLNLPLVHYAIKWFGTASHPVEVRMKTPEISMTLNVAMAVFPVFWLLIYRWVHDRLVLRDRAESVMARLRRLEENA